MMLRPRLVLESGALVHADGVAAIPVHRRAPQGEVDGRQRTAPLDQARESGEAHVDRPRRRGPTRVARASAAPAEHGPAQEHAEGGCPCRDRG